MKKQCDHLLPENTSKGNLISTFESELGRLKTVAATKIATVSRPGKDIGLPLKYIVCLPKSFLANYQSTFKSI